MLKIGDRLENQIRSIGFFEAALRVRTQSQYPVDWAESQTGLGLTILFSQPNNWDENSFRAISCFNAALNILTVDQFPQRWARLQFCLGTAFMIRSQSFAGLPDLQNAIASYELALQVRTELYFPHEWAETQYRLAMCYSRLPLFYSDELKQDDRERAVMHMVKAIRGYDACGNKDARIDCEKIIACWKAEWHIP
jgi:hypothetical protein